MPTWLSTQLNLFWLALSFFTRLPVPNSVQYSAAKMHTAGRYFSLVGWLLAFILLAVYTLCLPLFGIHVSVVVLLMLNLLLTGALHQDGLADTFDGFYGGQQQQQKLHIMKDSRLGTYGSCTLFITLLLQFALLAALAERQLLCNALFIAYPLSRAMALSHVQHLGYVKAQQSDKSSKSEPLASPLSQTSLTCLLVFAALGLICLPLSQAIIVVVCCSLLRVLIARWFVKHIGGYTGDTLGCAQQFQELLIYALLLAMAAPTVLIPSIG
ncbi:adenosylcobinamide-GDP ribazoletransferase [Paraglaciecola sp.]|uniref:adenosylcobinamide-GDP ribazoletransferase n=1 Tax=Paraglaciecola sp. TaxID=1920173 RepID=UPI0030F394CD